MDQNTLPIEDLQFENEEQEIIDESPIEDLSKIISYNVANTVEVLVFKIDNEEINLQPEFQRDFVWDINRASLFIDSLLIGLPIPSIFLGKSKEDENYIVIDGQQRLKSVYYFIKGNFKSNDVDNIFTLKNLKDRDWDGKTFAELDITSKRRIKNAVLNTTIVEDINSRPTVVHDLFHRLNTGGMPLTDQEIRNCVYNGVFNKMIMELNANDNWRILLNKTVPDRRLRDVELILRFYALIYKLNAYRPSMKLFLSTFQQEKKDDQDFVNNNIILFSQTINFIISEIGPDAFKLSRTINKSVCDSIMVAIGQIILNGGKPLNLKSSYNKLIEDADYKRYILSGTSTETSVTGRIDLARNYFLGLK